MQQVLHIKLVFHVQRRAIFSAESQLSSDGVESMTEPFHKFERIRVGSRGLRGGLPLYGGVGRGRGLRLWSRERRLFLLLWWRGDQ
ncbi:MAG: hypothetical protein RL042_2320 [Nitrospirota bacterium]